MNPELIRSLMVIAADLGAMLALYCAITHFRARVAWDRRGLVPVLLLIVMSQLFWIPLALLTARPNEFVGSSSFSPWFANWLVTGFGVILLQRKTRSIPKSLKDASRLDALGPIATWHHVVLPFVRRDLLLLTILL